MRLLSEYKISLAGKRVLVIGRSRTVGQPLAYLCTAQNAIVTLAHSEVTSVSLKEACLTADVVIPCTGSPGLVQSDWVKPGAVVVNVGAAFSNDELQPDAAVASAKIEESDLVRTYMVLCIYLYMTYISCNLIQN